MRPAQQGGGGIKGPSTAAPGSTIEIEAPSGATGITVQIGGGPATKLPVGPGGKTSIPIPPEVPPGTSVFIRDNRIPPSFLQIELVAPSP